MATVVLQAAASAAVSSIGIGSTFLTSLIAMGATMAGSAIDSALFSTTRRVTGARMKDFHLQSALEGEPIPLVYGRSRTTGQVIWASPYSETATTQTTGSGKSGKTKTTTYLYTVSVAIAVADAKTPINRIGRIWADGQPLNTDGLTIRIHNGAEDQEPDPLILAIEGEDNAPYYRGLCYVVFQDLPLNDFGYRVPNFSFEVIHTLDEGTDSLENNIQSVCLIPATGEFILATTPTARNSMPPEYENRHASTNASDLETSLDDLQSVCPNLENVSLVVSWFGTDLRASQCQFKPKIERTDKTTTPLVWGVSGLTRQTADTVSLYNDNPAYGGTPSDNSVVEAIYELNRRGLTTTYYPFILMDIPPTNTLINPYTNTIPQPPYPWRGRITTSLSPVCHNLLTYTNMTASPWILESSATRTTTQADPWGGTTGIVLNDASTTGTGGIRQAVTITPYNRRYTASVYIKKTTTAEYMALRLTFSATGYTSKQAEIRLNTQTGETATAFPNTDISPQYGIESHNDDWFRLWVSVKNNNTFNTLTYRIQSAISDTTLATSTPTATGQVTVASPQLNEGNLTPFVATSSTPLNTLDRTATTQTEVNTLFGSASPSHFTITGGQVVYTGSPTDWGYRRMILHQAKLCVLAGGVDTFIIGSELVGLTTLRSDVNTFPVVNALKTLADDVRTILGSTTKITYASDWTEYGAFQTNDGSGDVLFPLDSLWSYTPINAIGIDWYAPLTDWRAGTQHLDAQDYDSIYNQIYLTDQIEGGQAYDWYYASDTDRQNQTRTAINDTWTSQHWIYRPKDIRNWWSHAHYPRMNGVISPTPTAWTAQSKPIWLTELGCGAVTFGSNAPNLFPDPKSSEDALPPFSTGGADTAIQRALLQAYLTYWKPANGHNPTSTVYGQTMIDTTRTSLWCWDARPFPEFPARTDTWTDSQNWQKGHWLCGRLGSISLERILQDLVQTYQYQITATAPITPRITGYTLETHQTLEQAVTGLLSFHQINMTASTDTTDEKTLKITPRQQASIIPITTNDLVSRIEASSADSTQPLKTALTAPYALTWMSHLTQPTGLTVQYRDILDAYQKNSLTVLNPLAQTAGDIAEATIRPTSLQTAFTEDMTVVQVPLVLNTAEVTEQGTQLLMESAMGQAMIKLNLPLSFIALEVGDVLQFQTHPQKDPELWQITSLEQSTVLAVEAMKIEPSLYDGNNRLALPPVRTLPAIAPVIPELVILDLPLINGTANPYAPWFVVKANPWQSAVSVWKSASDDPSHSLTLDQIVYGAGVTGKTITTLYAGVTSKWDYGNALWVTMDTDTPLLSVTKNQLLNGANLMALYHSETGTWELLQFQNAELVDVRTYKLTTFLRGQYGTEHALTMGTPAPVGSTVVMMTVGTVSQLNATVNQPSLTGDDMNKGVALTAVQSGEDVGSPFSSTIMTVAKGQGAKPLSPVHIRVKRLSNGDLKITWLRRGRLYADSWEGEIPLGEETEQYRLQMYDVTGTTLKRTITTTTTSYTYTVSGQTTDFGSPLTLSNTLFLKIAQSSSVVGYGQNAIKNSFIN